MKVRNAVLASWFCLALFAACDREDDFLSGSDISLEFSVDTLRFDTVFTERGSATRSFRIINPNSRPVRIGRIYLRSGTASRFRLNVDGEPGDDFRDVRVLGKDSIWVFAEVTVDPDQPPSASPFVLNEEIGIQLEEQETQVVLEAWGQNANYFPSRFNAGVPVVLSCDRGEVVWDDPKPYVIYGEVFIDDCMLTIPAGARIYVHGGVARNELLGTFNDGFLYTLENGRIQVRGTAEQPVIIQGDRLEEPFREEEGQWTGIVLGKGSEGNLFEYATIKNSIFGIYVDSAATLTARNSQFYNTASSGLIAFHARIRADNCLFYNNYSTAVQLIHGGEYDFTYCTLASYGVNASALAMSNFYCYDDPGICDLLGINPLRLRMRNSIVFGSSRDEILFSDIYQRGEPDAFDVRFSECVVRVDELLQRQDGRYADFFETICTDCVNGSRQDPLFVDVDGDDYQLDTLSIARDLAVPVVDPYPIAIDLLARTRDPDRPDSGCYEFQE